jgi:hypothetical protein
LLIKVIFEFLVFFYISCETAPFPTIFLAAL